jgi:hypothetical protein
MDNALEETSKLVEEALNDTLSALEISMNTLDSQLIQTEELLDYDYKKLETEILSKKAKLAELESKRKDLELKVNSTATPIPYSPSSYDLEDTEIQDSKELLKLYTRITKIKWNSNETHPISGKIQVGPAINYFQFKNSVESTHYTVNKLWEMLEKAQEL